MGPCLAFCILCPKRHARDRKLRASRDHGRPLARSNHPPTERKSRDVQEDHAFTFPQVVTDLRPNGLNRRRIVLPKWHETTSTQNCGNGAT